jgi:hypothetical protein
MAAIHEFISTSANDGSFGFGILWLRAISIGGIIFKTRSISESYFQSPSAHAAKSNDLNGSLSSIARPNAFAALRRYVSA